MIDRRILLASAAGLFGFAALRWLPGAPARRPRNSRSRRPTRNGAPSSRRSNIKSCATKAPSARGPARCSRNIAKASSPAPDATCRCSPRRRNSKAAPAGRASISRLKMPSARTKTEPWACCAPKFIAAAAAAISDTSSTTGRSPPACAIAWTVSRWCFTRRPPRQAEQWHRQLLPARQMCPGPRTGAFLFKSSEINRISCLARRLRRLLR